MQFQSTLPCGERLIQRMIEVTVLNVSIHAPLRGATMLSLGDAGDVSEFQSTLPCGERPQAWAGSCPQARFNPRSLAGSDGGCLVQARRGWVSIHAPLRGATWTQSISFRLRMFQSTLPCGERPKSRHRVSVSKLFQSTLPCGERQCVTVSSVIVRMFQSTLPCGERPVARRDTCAQKQVSIHAPLRGATAGVVQGGSMRPFQSTLPCGERPLSVRAVWV